MAALLPEYTENGFVDGTFIHATSFCLHRHQCEKCKKYYEQLFAQSGGFYMCPYGMTSFVYTDKNAKHVFTGLRVKGYYKKQYTPIEKREPDKYNPLLEQSDILTLINSIIDSQIKIEAVDDVLHETRKLNGQIKNICDAIWEDYASTSEFDAAYLDEQLNSIHVCSYMIYNRFSYFDTIINPKLYIGDPYEAVIFKKFDKMRKLMKGYLRKNVWITISPNSFYKYKIYPTFETLLFIIFENAIKYSPDNSPVNVEFSEPHLGVLDVKIDSIGPYCEENEIVHLADKGFRSESARMLNTSGQGFGLSFAKEVCEKHRIGIRFSSMYSHKDHGVKYGHFSVNLHFDNQY